jgi:HD superfamily phosphohydrolase
MSEKIIRDPVHDVIALRLDRPTDSLLFRLINSVELQRLRRIRQLGMASLAYPGADHSRYSHSLGVMETARKVLEHLRRSHYVAEEDACACLVAALLHDIGHGPFSHVFERISGVHHEALTERVILDADSEVNLILKEDDPTLPMRAAELIRGRPRSTFLSDIISSQLDADRLDYLLRDNLMTGSQYGNYDLTWLIHALVIDEGSGRLAVDRKGISAVEAYLQSRYHMYRNVYFHKVVRSAEGMVKLALERARMLTEQEQLDWPALEPGVQKALRAEVLSIREFVDLDDVSVQHCFKRWARAPDPVLAGLCRGLMERRLFKTLDLSSEADPRAAVHEIEGEIRRAGGDAAFDCFYDEISDTPYDTGAGEILVRGTDGKLRDFGEMSLLPQVLSRQLLFKRVHVAPRWRDAAERVLRKT